MALFIGDDYELLRKRGSGSIARPEEGCLSGRTVVLQLLSSLLAVAGFAYLAGCGATNPEQKGGTVVWQGTTETATLLSGGLQRSYTVYLPKGYQSSKPRPLLLVFHGAGGTGAGIRGVGLDSWADRLGFITVYPDAAGGGARHTWALGCFQCTWADVQGIDDYRFIRELLDALTQKYSVNRARVAVTGVSLGGSFAFDFACHSSDLILGSALVASLPSPAELTGCQSGLPISVMIMNGDQDPNIPWDGGGQYNYLSNAAAAEFWAMRDTCPATPVATSLPDLNGDGKLVRLSAYLNCASSTFVRSYRIEGGGHAWPSGDLDASRVIAETFFGE